MEQCSDLLLADPSSLRGNWRNRFPDKTKLYVELGCGKGSFTAKLAAAEPNAAVIAVERVPDAMILAMERAKKEKLTNVLFLDAAQLAS